MPVASSDSLQLAIVRETAPGVVPVNPVWEIVRTTGESLTFSPNVSESAEIGGSGRFAKPGNVTGMAINGDISFELSKSTAMDLMIAGVLANDWGDCPLTGAAGGAIDSSQRNTAGKSLHTYTIEKRFDNPNFVKGALLAVADGGTGTQTSTITFTGAASAGTGRVWVNVRVPGTGAKQAIDIAIPVGSDPTAAATIVKDEINKRLTNVTATSAAGVVTIDAGTGNTIDSLAVAMQSDPYLYQRFKGATFSALTLSATPNNTVTGSVTVVGGTPEINEWARTGSTYNAAGTNDVFTAPELTSAIIGKMAVGTYCFTELTINIDSQNRGIPCIGTQGDREVVLGTLTASVTGNVYFTSNDILRALLDNDKLGDGYVTFANGKGDFYRFDLFGLKPLSGTVAAGGAGQDLIVPIEMQPTPVKVCDDGTNDWLSGLIVSKVDSKPTLP